MVGKIGPRRLTKKRTENNWRVLIHPPVTRTKQRAVARVVKHERESIEEEGKHSQKVEYRTPPSKLLWPVEPKRGREDHERNANEKPYENEIPGIINELDQGSIEVAVAIEKIRSWIVDDKVSTYVRLFQENPLPRKPIPFWLCSA